jgi:HSP20 family protein
VLFSTAAWSPHIDVYETDDKVVVLVDLAGVPREEIQVEVEHNHLTLRGERRPPHRDDARVFYALEVPYGAFERTIQLPFVVNSGQTEASYQDGFLEIVLPRVAPQQPTRVNIRSTEQGEQ